MSPRAAATPVTVSLARTLTAMGLASENSGAYYAEARSVLYFGASLLLAHRPQGAVSLRLARLYWCAATQLQLCPPHALHTLDRLASLLQEAAGS